MKKKIEVRISQQYKTKYITNKISGHSWPVDTLLNKWDVHTPCGVDTFRSYKKAEEYRKEMQDFYDKFFNSEIDFE